MRPPFPVLVIFCELGAAVNSFMGYIKQTLNAQDLPLVMAWLQGEPEGMIVGLSLCLLNGGVFPLDHIPDQFRSILEREQRTQLRSQVIGRVLSMSQPY